MLIHKAPDISSHEITPQSVYLSRRRLIGMGAGFAGAALLTIIADQATAINRRSVASLKYRRAGEQLAGSGYYTDEELTPLEDVLRYNNFYEFGTGKGDPAKYAGELTTSPWTVKIDGAVGKPGSYHLEDLLSRFPLQERIYRLRCVEAWSMVIPWVGFPLADLLRHVEMGSDAKYVSFTTLHRPKEMRGQRSITSIIDWPYREGLRIDEAMHPLTLLAVGLYGKVLYPQNGAPIRLVVPWKYGFKSIKSIVGIRLGNRQPRTSWQTISPREYGFYANVNPDVDHPRWPQSSERRLPGSLFGLGGHIKTRIFNGYADQVAHLYQGMDLRRNF